MQILKFMIPILYLLIFKDSYAITTVGVVGDKSCDFTELQLALDIEDDVIYVSRGSILTGAYDVSNNTSIIGGFDDCSDMTINSPDDKTVIHGNNAGPIFSYNSINASSEVLISNLDIKNATNNSGIYISGLLGTVTIKDSYIQDNLGNFGSGIFINGVSTNDKPKLNIVNSAILNNTANLQGGGIHCSRANIFIDDTTLIANNQVFGNNANGNGGGIYANQCQLDIYAGHIDGESAGVIANLSTNKGAGIYATNSQLNINGQQDVNEETVYGNTSHPVLFKDNVSDSDQNSSGYGGALYLSASEATIKAVWFDGNKGSELGIGEHNKGAVFHADFQSVVTMTRDIEQPCWRGGLCNLVSNNLHVAIYAQRPGTIVSITDTEFFNNTADFTSLIWARNGCCTDSGFGPTLNFENNLVHNNNSLNVGLIKTDSDTTNNCCELEVNILNNTITNNNFVEGSSVININSHVTLNMHNNIVYESSGINVLDSLEFITDVNLNISCLISHEINSIPILDLTIFVENPLFLNPLFYDYHLTQDSPAIDVCGSEIYTPLRLDIDQQTQDRDDPLVINIDGYFDLGVDEYYQPDEIFKNSFEQ